MESSTCARVPSSRRRRPPGHSGPQLTVAPRLLMGHEPGCTTTEGRKRMSSTVIPVLRYRDAPAAIDWLCRTFGFERQLVVPGEEGAVAHAQLRLGTGMIMLGSVVETEFGRWMQQPDEIGGRETETVYVVVPDADVVYARAKAAGAQILLDIKNEDYGGRGFTCRDPQGHIWSLGTYDPWAQK